MLCMKTKSSTLSTPENLIYGSEDFEFGSNISEKCSSKSNSIAKYFYDIYNSINDSSTPLANNDSAYMETPTRVKFHNVFANLNKNISPTVKSHNFAEGFKKIDNTNKTFSSVPHFKPRCLLPELTAEYGKTNPSSMELPMIYKGFQKNRDFKIFTQALIFKSDQTNATQDNLRYMKQSDFVNPKDTSTKLYKVLSNEKKKISVFRDNFAIR